MRAWRAVLIIPVEPVGYTVCENGVGVEVEPGTGPVERTSRTAGKNQNITAV